MTSAAAGRKHTARQAQDKPIDEPRLLLSSPLQAEGPPVSPILQRSTPKAQRDRLKAGFEPRPVSAGPALRAPPTTLQAGNTARVHGETLPSSTAPSSKHSLLCAKPRPWRWRDLDRQDNGAPLWWGSRSSRLPYASWAPGSNSLLFLVLTGSLEASVQLIDVDLVQALLL